MQVAQSPCTPPFTLAIKLHQVGCTPCFCLSEGLCQAYHARFGRDLGIQRSRARTWLSGHARRCPLLALGRLLCKTRVRAANFTVPVTQRDRSKAILRCLSALVRQFTLARLSQSVQRR